ncbi:hypothetical protein [Desulfolucanica intricata]
MLEQLQVRPETVLNPDEVSKHLVRYGANKLKA